MKVKITNFRGVKRADLELDQVTIVAGRNASGKSSTALALAAAMTGQPIVLAGMKKTEAGMLVHAGTGKGAIVVETSNGKAEVTYPTATVKTDGAPPYASRFAVGLDDLTTMQPKDAAAFLLDYLKATPTKAELFESLKDLALEEKKLEALWLDCQDLGWDGAHQAAKNNGATLKGRWEQVTGGRWGSAKGEQWLPQGWELGLETASEETLTAAITQAHEFRDAAVAAAAVSVERRDQLAAEAAKLDGVDGRISEAETIANAAASTLTQQRNSLAQIPLPAAQQVTVACPHCGAPVVAISKSKLEKPAERDAAAEEELTKSRSAQQAKVAAAETSSRAAATAVSNLRADTQRAENAAKQLAALPEHDPSTAGEVERARESVRREETKLAAFKAQRQAHALHVDIMTHIGIVNTLAPEGLRLRKMTAAVTRFNADLATLSTAAKWGVVELDASSLSVVYDGKPLMLLSESEKFRAAATVRFALAKLDASGLVVVDAADILDPAGRNGLMRIAAAHASPVLLCMTMRPDELPKLTPPRGRVYWLEGGVAELKA